MAEEFLWELCVLGEFHQNKKKLINVNLIGRTQHNANKLINRAVNWLTCSRQTRFLSNAFCILLLLFEFFNTTLDMENIFTIYLKNLSECYFNVYIYFVGVRFYGAVFFLFFLLEDRSFVFFEAGILFCGFMVKEVNLLRKMILPMGAKFFEKYFYISINQVVNEVNQIHMTFD